MWNVVQSRSKVCHSYLVTIKNKIVGQRVLPLGITPASINVARLKLAITKRVTTASHSGMAIET